MSYVGNAAMRRRSTAPQLDTTMTDMYDDNNNEENNNDAHNYSNSHTHLYNAKATATPSPRTDSENNQHEFDDHNNNNNNNNSPSTTPTDDDDVFLFDAPTYYDLKNPALEAQYVNNADGYFTPEYKARREVTVTAAASIPTPVPVPSTALTVTTPPRASIILPTAPPAAPTRNSSKSNLPHPNEALRVLCTSNNNDDMNDDATMHVDELHASRLQNSNNESFEQVFAHYATASAAAAALSSSSGSRPSLAQLLAEPLPAATATATASSNHNTSSRMHTDTAMAVAPPPAPSAARPPRATTAPSHSTTSSTSSTLLQPTQAFLRRVHTEHAMREQSHLDGAPLADRPLKLTTPHGPLLLTSKKAAEQLYNDPNDPSRLSYTSRELLQIQEERLRVQLERMKIREFHERSKAQRPPANVHQRSTKQLTIPVSPYLEVGHRTRRFHDDSVATAAAETTTAATLIRPETLMSRDFALPMPHVNANNSNSNNTAPPHLLTAERASRRAVETPAVVDRPAPVPDYARMKVNGVTQPLTPQLETTRRAQSHPRPIDVVDHDAIELARKFHAQPVRRAVLAPKPLVPPPSSARAAKTALTQPVSPKLTTSARVASRQSAAERTAAAIADLARRRKDRELQRQQQRNTRPPPPPATASSASTTTTTAPRRPTIPESPDLHGLRRHRQYQENLRQRMAAEDEALRHQRVFKAQPMRVTTTPPPFPGSTKPLTEVVPFALPGEQYLERARARLAQKKRDEAAHRAAQTTFRAMPMPVFASDGAVTTHDSALSSAHENGATRPRATRLTTCAAPALASDRRAAERAAFDAAERARREREDAQRQQVEAEAAQRQADELRALRREKLTFHARPAPASSRGFSVRPSDKPLTEPHSPALQYHPHHHHHRHERSSNSSEASL